MFILWDKIVYAKCFWVKIYLETGNMLVFCIPPCCTRKCKLNLYIYISSSPLICRQMGMRTDKYMRQKRRLFQRSKTMPICHSTNQTLSYTYTILAVASSFLYTSLKGEWENQFRISFHTMLNQERTEWISI